MELLAIVVLYFFGILIRYGVGPSRRRPPLWKQCCANLLMLLGVSILMSDLLKLSLEAFIIDVNRYMPLLIVMAMTIEHGILCNECFDRYMLSLTGRRGRST